MGLIPRYLFLMAALIAILNLNCFFHAIIRYLSSSKENLCRKFFLQVMVGNFFTNIYIFARLSVKYCYKVIRSEVNECGRARRRVGRKIKVWNCEGICWLSVQSNICLTVYLKKDFTKSSLIIFALIVTVSGIMFVWWFFKSFQDLFYSIISLNLTKLSVYFNG